MQNWEDIRIFLAVARAQSLSAGAKLVQMDPATLGRRIARLEAQMGVGLFVKSPQGYALTPDGMALMARAQAAEAALETGPSGLNAGQGGQGLQGQIRIGAPDGCANYLLPQVCARISQDHPNLDLHIVALPRVVNLTKREADMAISVSAPTSGRHLVQKIVDYQLHLAAAPTYLQGKPPVLSIDDLRAHRVIGYIPDMIFDKELDYLADLGVSRVPLASNSVSVQLNAIRQGAGLGVVHDFSLPIVGGVKRVLTDKISLTRSFYLVRPVEDRRVAHLTQFAELLVLGLRREVARLEALA
ncbi:MAG: LysR family transcriptional regulator [Paracoccaceae bacterium]